MIPIRTLIAFLALLHAATGMAQYAGIGLKAGPQMSTFRVVNIRSTPVPGLTLGAYMPIGAAPRLELQPELLLTVLGTGLEEPDGDRQVLRTLYLQAPITAKYFLNTTVNLQGGMQFAQLLMAQRSNIDSTTNVRHEFKGFDLGFIVGLGFDLYSGVDLTIRYYSGMSTLLKNDDALFARNRSIQFTLGKRLTQVRKMPTTRRRR